MPGSRAPSQARTQGALGSEDPSVTEDVAWRRVIAGQAPPNVAGRVTHLSLALPARSGHRPFQAQKGRDPARPAARGRSGAHEVEDAVSRGPARGSARSRTATGRGRPSAGPDRKS